ncbi:MAG: hypothetical protein HRT88_10980 [Lentisphaeraceae bacterium]|nr:hypothetical protein [Lentisphaeraceae bacterium]
MSRRKTLNLGSTSPAPAAEEENINTGAPEPQAPKTKKSAKEDKARITHYLSTSVLSELEEIYDEIRRRLPYSEKSKVKKSHLVDFAIDNLVKDYYKKGDKSLIAKKFLK